MAKIRPFCGILYNEKKIKNLDRVVAPPYDVISERQHNMLFNASKYNFVRLVLDKRYPIGSNSRRKYESSKRLLKQWLDKGILIKDRRPAIYAYEQLFSYNKKRYSRCGFVTLLKLEDFKNNVVYPHEKVYPIPKNDRIMIISKTKSNLSPIFSLFLDKRNCIDRILQGVYKNHKPQTHIKFENVWHRLWRITNSDLIEKIKAAMEDKQIFIADGHHRYEAALAFRDMMYKRFGRTKKTEDRFGWCMMYFLNLNSKGLVIMPTHRLIRCDACKDIKTIYKRLSNLADIKGYKTKNIMLSTLKNPRETRYLFGMYLEKDGFYILRLKQNAVKKINNLLGRLDVNILHNLILPTLGFKDTKYKNNTKISYTPSPDEAIGLVKNKRFNAAFFLNPTKVNQVKAIARMGQKMPHKSTYFYPKLLSGLVLYKFA